MPPPPPDGAGGGGAASKQAEQIRCTAMQQSKWSHSSTLHVLDTQKIADADRSSSLSCPVKKTVNCDYKENAHPGELPEVEEQLEC